ncbi:MAG TPA: serine/threonine protein phosphatase, partial [Bacteroidetes bacterium]|nr:serine/threonine protein phosphatase [Bacteroidota bacterium]
MSNEFLNFINMGKRTFVFGDIHGCYLTFKSLFEQCDIAKSDAIYLLG